MSDVDIRVGKRAQVVIPAALRKQMGVTDGDRLSAEIDEHGRLVLEKVSEDPLARLLQAGRDLLTGDPVEGQQALREEWATRGAP